jgi:hypothetical protein
METVYVVVTIITIVANAGIAVADLARAPFVIANATEVGVPRSWLGPLAILKAAGAAGLALGLIGVRPIGLAAAAGLVAFFVGAITAHARARIFYNIAFPGVFLVLALASLVSAVARGSP